MKPLVLASASPRRQALLRQFGYTFEVCAPEVDELSIGEPVWVAGVNARSKAEAARLLFPEAVILAADTVVVIDGAVLGKPRDADDAYDMLARLSRREHQVTTGVAVAAAEGDTCFHVTTQVWFRALEQNEIKQYIASREPFGKAGAYAIQGFGGLFVEQIHGCYYNVVGLPVPRLAVELRQRGYDPLA